jgi:hypothetical protein
MTVVDFGARRRKRGRRSDRNGGHQWVPAKDSPRRIVREPASRQRRRIQGLGVLTVTGGPEAGSAVVSAAVMPHPISQNDVVAFLVERGSAAHSMLQSTKVAQFSFEREAPRGLVAGPVELVQADPIQADWFRWMVGEVFTAAGGTPDDWNAHDQTIGVRSTVVAFLRPEQISQRSSVEVAKVEPSPISQHRSRHATGQDPVSGGGAA